MRDQPYDRTPCPECNELVECRFVEVEGNYPGAMVWQGIQVKRGPEHTRRCKHWCKETPVE